MLQPPAPQPPPSPYHPPSKPAPPPPSNPAPPAQLVPKICGKCRPEDLCLTFSCGNGLAPEADLVAHGSQIAVTSANWQEYYKYMLAFKLHNSIATEVEALRKGFQHAVDDRTMQLLHRCRSRANCGMLSYLGLGVMHECLPLHWSWPHS